MNLILSSTECLLTLVGVILYENLKNVTKALSIGVAAPMLGIAMTAVGVYMTLAAKKGKKETAVALAIHAGLWLLKGVIGWLAGVAIAVFIILRVTGKLETNEMPYENVAPLQLPDRLFSGGNTYRRVSCDSTGALYVNERDESDTYLIRIIYKLGDGFVSTDAGKFRLM